MLDVDGEFVTCHASIVTRYLSLLKQVHTSSCTGPRVPECSFQQRVQVQQKMSGYKLYYFNGRGRSETSRLSFAAANIEFEDIRLDGEAWAKEKACR